MIKYALTRLGLLIVGLAVASVLIFVTLRVLPGDAAQLIAGTKAPPEQVEAIRESLASISLYLRNTSPGSPVSFREISATRCGPGHPSSTSSSKSLR